MNCRKYTHPPDVFFYVSMRERVDRTDSSGCAVFWEARVNERRARRARALVDAALFGA